MNWTRLASFSANVKPIVVSFVSTIVKLVTRRCPLSPPTVVRICSQGLSAGRLACIYSTIHALVCLTNTPESTRHSSPRVKP